MSFDLKKYLTENKLTEAARLGSSPLYSLRIQEVIMKLINTDESVLTILEELDSWNKLVEMAVDEPISKARWGKGSMEYSFTVQAVINDLLKMGEEGEYALAALGNIDAWNKVVEAAVG
jgi:hypothetical protein